VLVYLIHKQTTQKSTVQTIHKTQ